MEHSRVALPDSSYLARIGELAFTVSSMEWQILGDLRRLASDLPKSLTLDHVEPETTSGIAKKIKAATAEVAESSTKDYLVAVYRALYVAADIRNDVLHARPATHPDGSQRLVRSETMNRQTTGARFWIDDAWFDAAITVLNNSIRSISDRRPPLI